MYPSDSAHDHGMPPEPPAKPLVEHRWIAPSTREEILARAESLVGRPITYKLGAGQILHPWQKPGPGHSMDCSEFACWALGISKMTSDPLFVRFNGGWRNTSAIVFDGRRAGGIFTEAVTAQPGDLIVYGSVPGHVGHVGVVSKTRNGAVTEVIDCSSYHQRTKGYAVARRSPSVWIQNRAIVVRPDWISDGSGGSW